jgi:UDP-2,3-diacylglucosamine pyrophosphatase LpxH
VSHAQEIIREQGFTRLHVKLKQHTVGANPYTDWCDYEIMDVLSEVSLVLDKYPVKALFLPQIKPTMQGFTDEFLLSEATLERLNRWHADSCLILQPQERPHSYRVTVFDVFPYFEIALRQTESWPAVLFWDNKTNRSAFVPVTDEESLERLFEIVQTEGGNCFETLNAHARLAGLDNYYCMQLSDLHFGTKNLTTTQRQLQSLVTTQLSSLTSSDHLTFIVTGDVVDSPGKKNDAAYREFAEFLEEKNGEEPLFVLGNHDISMLGLGFFRNKQSLTHLKGTYPKIIIAEDFRAIFMLFNSNTRGFLAQGEIGKRQMSEMEKLLHEVPDLEEYTLVAVLHHHVAPSSCYMVCYGNERWREEVMPDGFHNRSLRLRDADKFMKFLGKHKVRFVLHGHKHTPIIVEQEGIYIIACGSSTGHAKEYLSYNMLKFNKETLTCAQIVTVESESNESATAIMSVVLDY